MKKGQKTLCDIFADPIRADIRWADIEALLRAEGAKISEGSGSRVRIAVRGCKAVFHRPHPGDQTGKPTLRDVRDLLNKAGIKP